MQAKSIDILIPPYDGDMRAGKPNRSTRADFAARLTALREKAGLSQRAVAREMGISQPSYANWESHNVALKPEQLTKLAQVLGVSVADLLDDTRNSATRRGGPTGRTRRAFETVSRLPRTKQQRIVDVVEALVAQNAGS